jgi:uncharacterized protein YbaR (Trm112 family)
MAAASGINDLPISPLLLEILACPACASRPAVCLTDDKQFLQCVECRRKYPIKEGIPVMLVEEAISEKT